MNFPGKKQVNEKVIEPVKKATALAITAIIIAFTALLAVLAAI